jgi:hypothetical protein
MHFLQGTHRISLTIPYLRVLFVQIINVQYILSLFRDILLYTWEEKELNVLDVLDSLRGICIFYLE